MQIWHCQEKRSLIIIFPACLNFMNCTVSFLPLFRMHREYFYDWCEIGSIYGAPSDCIWGGGRTSFGTTDPRDVLALMQEYGISSRLTFINSLLQKEHLADPKCNALCQLFSGQEGPQNGVIVHSDLLLNYLEHTYPDFYFVSSTTKVLTDFTQLIEELNREVFHYVVPDFRLNNAAGPASAALPQAAEGQEWNFCAMNAAGSAARSGRPAMRQSAGRSLGVRGSEHRCTAPDMRQAATASPKAMENPGFVGVADILERYLPMGFSNFKIEGRGLRQCPDSGIFALLPGQSRRHQLQCPGGNLSGQYAGYILR